MSDEPLKTMADRAALRERMAQWRRYNAFQDEERRRKQADPERLGREWLMMIAVQRRLVREGVGTAPSDWEEHMAWSRVQKALMGLAPDASWDIDTEADGRNHPARSADRTAAGGRDDDAP